MTFQLADAAQMSWHPETLCQEGVYPQDVGNGIATTGFTYRAAMNVLSFAHTFGKVVKNDRNAKDS